MQKASKSQQQAIEHGEGPMLVMAGPGSGKTFVIIQRLLYLINDRNVLPEKILVISFSKASARELKERFKKERKGIAAEVLFSTFHAYFFSILKETYHYTSNNIISNAEKHRLLRTILYDPMYNPISDTDNYIPPDRMEEAIEELLSKISFYKNIGTDEMNKKESSWFLSVFYGYNRLMHEERKIDFDDMGLLCLKLFQKNNQSLAKWQLQFKYVLIDEFQDINEIQFRNIYYLCSLHHNIFVVGDDDQSIYGFRGSSPGFMLDFQKYYPATKKVLLETNFRCSGNIVEKSLSVIGENKFRIKKSIKACKDPGAEVTIKNFINQYEEYEYVTDQIREYVDTGGHLDNIACIFRTNSQMMFLTDFFLRKKIPFTMKEKARSIFRHFIAKDIFHYLKFFKEGKKRKDFLVIMNKPLRYISRNSCNSEVVNWCDLYNYYKGKIYITSNIQTLERMEQWMKKLDLYGAISYLRKAGEYEKYLKEYCHNNDLLWEEALDILEFVHNSTRNLMTVAEWEEEIKQYEKSIEQSEKNSSGVRIMTMHACKGLEFSYVFIPDCNEGKVPHNRATSVEEVEEERRMFYVAMTRAMDKLEILYLKDKKDRILLKSRFINSLCDKRCFS